MPWKSIVFVILILLAGYGLFAPMQNVRQPVTTQPIYQQVMAKKTLRCGYAAWNQALIVNPDGSMSGIIYDTMQAVSRLLDIKIEWVEEVPWGDFPTALDTGRIDTMCAGVWPNAKRAKLVDFVEPLYYVPFYAYAQISDGRFDQDLNIVNDPQYKIAMTDGETSSLVAMSDFPRATPLAQPQLSDVTQNFLNVATGKADIHMNDLASYRLFEQSNPDQLKIVPTAKPLRLFPVTIAVKASEHNLRRLLMHAIQDLKRSGELARILDKYDPQPNVLIRP